MLEVIGHPRLKAGEGGFSLGPSTIHEGFVDPTHLGDVSMGGNASALGENELEVKVGMGPKAGGEGRGIHPGRLINAHSIWQISCPLESATSRDFLEKKLIGGPSDSVAGNLRPNMPPLAPDPSMVGSLRVLHYGVIFRGWSKFCLT